MNLAELHKPFEIDYISLLLRECKNKTFSEILEILKKENKEQWFFSLKPADLFKLRDYKHVETTVINDVEKYRQDVLDLLTRTELGESKRGLSTKEILGELKGTPSQCRSILESLKKENKIWKTGKTQGVRWVLYKYRDLAEKQYLRSR